MSVHPTIAAFTADGNCLAVGGVPIDRLAERIGSTPFFAYDRRMMTDRVSYLRSILPPEIHLHYAVKANPMPAVVQHMAGLVDGCDVASAMEMKVVLDTPTSPEHISFAGPGKTAGELAQAIAAGVTIEMESANEAQRIVEIGNRLGIRPRVALRVNPDFQIKGSGMRMGGGPQQFGVDADQVPDLLKQIVAADLEFLGFHIFAGSQNLHADILCEAQNKTVELLLDLADRSPSQVSYLNLGGGFGIPYFDKDRPLDLAPLGENIAKLIDTAIRPRLPHCRVVMEFGRYLVGEAGIYASRVIDRKVSRGRTYLVVDGGLHHQLAASGNFGQVIRRNYPMVVANKMDATDLETVTVVGCLCTPLDTLGDNVSLARADVGDMIVLFQAGAYGLTASPTAFLGHPMPAEVLV
ncbi:pyridoxal-dependent decarboxylase, exosortase A system-associated [Mesorhizobium sp. CU2]|uniref:pyridoxal-dependent decarboxylase, exosortase A system-associated n=1 Tax=unclassified Mesorhizobium TaxID=325217 RepID=UPI001128ED70|nr:MULTISPECIES: pyridoxal-dependent decarboxylase, exosortase A system-associated [unclassified Mesorhizobium]TPN85052.1 pyridoxal-dependent decarboxylase, exosortase A system-associated [Mesorhizobium sp. CU3]TPO13011.1 pyridoxal-dependent decarboxylase, exosortase A system-associated [Mesorhizobium sp. CU2]